MMMWHANNMAPVALAVGSIAAFGCAETGTPAVGASTSASFLDAARFAIEDARAAGFDLPLDTAFIFESSIHAEPALRAAHTFARMPGIVGVVGHSNSAASLAASQVYNQNEIVQLSPTASAVVYSRAGPYSFRLVPPDDQQGRFLAEVVRDSVAADARVALLYVNDEYGRGLRSSFLDAWESVSDGRPLALDLPHAADEHLGPEVRDHLVEATIAADPDVLLWLGRATPLDTVLPPLRASLGAVPIIASDGTIAGARMPNPDGRWTGLRYVDFVDLSATPEARTFVRSYQERFGIEPTSGDALTYDAMGLLLEALRNGARTGPDARDYLLSLGRTRPPYQGVTGEVRFDAEGDVQRSYRLARIGGAVP